MSGARILIIEDEPQLRHALSRYLEESSYEPRACCDGESGLQEFGAFKPDLVLLDLMLPGMSGLEVCRSLRATSGTPIVVLSAIGEEKKKVEALDEGADDYLTKPFGMDELLARIRVALRHAGSTRSGDPLIKAGDLSIDLARREVTAAGRPVSLTPTEFSLLKYMVTHAGKILTHPMILSSVWGQGYDDTAVLRTYINQLRVKLEDDPIRPRYIRTEPRVGYRFIAADEAPES